MVQKTVSRKVLLVAGEASGDLLGAELMRVLQKTVPDVVFYGVGGPAMRKAGLKSLGDIRLFPGMLLAALPALPRLYRLGKKLTAWAARHKPLLCLTIDNQEFSARLAANIAPLGVPCVQYVAPKVWAWRQGRVTRLRQVYRHVLCLFPFEADFFNAHNLPATYIGHPVMARMEPYLRLRRTRKGPPTLLLCPGSRPAELTRHWPLFLATFKLLRERIRGLKGTVALVDNHDYAFCRSHGWDRALTPALGEARFPAMARATAALTKSGTNNLELALLGVPAVVAYRASALTMWLARKLVQVKFISPVNLVAGQGVYPEFIQDDATIDSLSATTERLLRNKIGQKATATLLKRIRGALTTQQPSVDIAAATLAPYLAASPLPKPRRAPK